MIAEAIQKLREMCEAASKPRVFRTSPNDGILVANGQTTTFNENPPTRQYSVGSLDDFILLLQKESDPAKASLWVGQSLVSLVFDRETRLDSAAMKMHASDITKYIARPEMVTQADMLQRLREGCYGALSPDLIGPLSTLKWSHGGSTAGAVGHGKESLGKSLERQVESSAERIPDTVTTTFPYFMNPGMVVSLPLVVTLHMGEEKISLRPKAGAMDEALLAVQKMVVIELAEQLHGEGLDEVPVYRGNPRAVIDWHRSDGVDDEMF